MGRPKSRRRVFSMPRYSDFVPLGASQDTLEEVILTVDELEAIRLSDLDGMYQAQAAKKMNVSRQTFGRILDTAHRKVAQALIEGSNLKIIGGTYKTAVANALRCVSCDNEWQTGNLDKDSERCPRCKSDMVEPV